MNRDCKEITNNQKKTAMLETQKMRRKKGLEDLTLTWQNEEMRSREKIASYLWMTEHVAINEQIIIIRQEVVESHQRSRAKVYFSCTMFLVIYQK